ncbi:MAG: glycosyltransferase family 4 protein [Anaerolineales bacterium]|jgi:glycosyltransferase involved in cell wall biosynthesis|nr:glycosyltransferase family 4 protein [Anaerolineales bacterium]MCW5838943.1 glycosyltransferase family 4 protein [Anaerolineales bacterium]
MKARIAYLLQMFGVGGMPKWLYRLAGELADEFDFHFIATHSDYVLPEYRQVAQVAVVPFRKLPLAGYLLRQRIDLAQIANLRLYADAARLAGVPSVIERVDGMRSGAALGSKAGLDAVVASTAGMAQHLAGLMPSEKIHTIYNGVDLAAVDAAPIERFGLGTDKIIIGRTSRLGGGKNLSLLIAAVKQLRQHSHYQHVHLVICGGDTTQPGAVPMLAQLRAEAAALGAAVTFTGEVADPMPVTKGFDIATCTSLPNNEGIPNSLIEAMAASKPVVASAVDDIPELVQDGQTGLLFESNNVAALAAALARLVEDAALRQRMGAAGRARIERDFDLHQQAERYRQLYRSLLQQNGRHWLSRF